MKKRITWFNVLGKFIDLILALGYLIVTLPVFILTFMVHMFIYEPVRNGWQKAELFQPFMQGRIAKLEAQIEDQAIEHESCIGELKEENKDLENQIERIYEESGL